MGLFDESVEPSEDFGATLDALGSKQGPSSASDHDASVLELIRQNSELIKKSMASQQSRKSEADSGKEPGGVDPSQALETIKQLQELADSGFVDDKKLSEFDEESAAVIRGMAANQATAARKTAEALSQLTRVLGASGGGSGRTESEGKDAPAPKPTQPPSQPTVTPSIDDVLLFQKIGQEHPDFTDLPRQKEYEVFYNHVDKRDGITFGAKLEHALSTRNAEALNNLITIYKSFKPQIARDISKRSRPQSAHGSTVGADTDNQEQRHLDVNSLEEAVLQVKAGKMSPEEYDLLERKALQQSLLGGGKNRLKRQGLAV